MKNNHLNISLIVLALLLPAMAMSSVGLSAQERTLTLDECRRMAAENDRSVAIARQTASKTESDRSAIWANFFPQVSAQGFYVHTPQDLAFSLAFPEGSQVTSLPFDVNARNVLVGGLTVKQPVYMGGKILTGYRMASIGTEMGALNVEMTRQKSMLGVEDIYWKCVEAKEMLGAALQYQKAVAEVERVVGNAVKQGFALNNDLLTVQVKADEAELNVAKARNGVKLAKMALCSCVGMPLDSQVEVSDSLDISGIEALAMQDPDSGFVASRVEYKLLQKQVDLKKQNERLVLSDFLPSVGIAGQYDYLTGPKVNGYDLPHNLAFAALAVKIPIAHWGEGAAKVRSAKAETAIAELQRDDAADKMRLENRRALNTLDEAILEVNLQQKTVDKSCENMRVVTNRYRNGMCTVADVLAAQTLWQKASADLVTAKAALRLAYTDYRRTLGETL